MKNGFRIFDTHVHIGSALHSGREKTAAQMLADMDAYGVDRALLIPFPMVRDYRAQHDLLGAAVRAHPDRFCAAICLDPFVPREKFVDEVRRCTEVLGFVALKLQPKFQPLNPVFERNDFFFEAAARHKLTVVAHTGDGLPFSAPSLYIAPARRFPEVQFVLGHAGGSIFFLESIVAASVCDNISIELSTLMPNHVGDIVSRVKSDRLMIGSDLPECQDVEIGKILNAGYSEADKRNILWNTAERLFGKR
jgi:hypothetical protein